MNEADITILFLFFLVCATAIMYQRKSNALDLERAKSRGLQKRLDKIAEELERAGNFLAIKNEPDDI